MKRLFLCLVFLLFSVGVVWADSTVKFKWDSNFESDLAGYNLYQSDVSMNYTPGVDKPVAVIPAGTETLTLDNVSDGHKFWVLTAFDLHGNESEISNEVNVVLDTLAPGVPTLEITVITTTTVTVGVKK